MSAYKFGTAINCMDGRVQEPVAKYIRRKYLVDYVDVITEPGPARAIAEDWPLVATIRARLQISLDKHRSSVVAVVGHHDCAGNPVPMEQQLEQIKAAVEAIRGWGVKAEVVGLWVGDDWLPVKVR